MDINSLFVYEQASFANTSELFESVGRDFVNLGYAQDSFPTALAEREAAYPTGLPVSGGVAIPHTDASHVIKDALAVITLADPVEFGEMGGQPTDTVAAQVAIMLLIADSHSHVKFLSKVIKAVQDTQFMASLSSADSQKEIEEAVAAKLGLQ